MKKRSRDSISPPLPYSKKKQKGPKRSSKKRILSGPITKDEEEAAATLFALAGLFADNNTNDESKGNYKSSEKPNHLNVPKSNESCPQAVEVAKNNGVASESSVPSSSTERLPETVKDEPWNKLNLSSDDYVSRVTLHSLPDNIESQSNVKPLCMLSDLNSDARLSQALQKKALFLERKPESALRIATPIGSQTEQPQHNLEDSNKSGMVEIKNKWADVDEEFEKARDELRAQAQADPAEEVGPPKETVAGEQSEKRPLSSDEADDDYSPPKKRRIAAPKVRKRKSVPEPSLQNEGLEGLVVSDEVKAQLPYPIRGIVNDIGEHYTVEQWRSITSGSLTQRVKLVHAQSIAAMMSTFSVMAEIKVTLSELEKRAVEAEKKLKKEKETTRNLTQQVASADAATAKALAEKAKFVKALEAEKLEFKGALEAEKLKFKGALEAEKLKFKGALEAEKKSAEESSRSADAAGRELAKMKLSRDRDIAQAKFDVTDPKGPIIQPLIKRCWYRGYRQAVVDIKEKYPDLDVDVAFLDA